MGINTRNKSIIVSIHRGMFLGSRKKAIIGGMVLLITLCLGLARLGKAEELNDFLQEGIKAIKAARYGEALHAWEAGLRLAEAKGHTQAQGVFLGNIGMLYENLGQFEKALGYHEKALAIHRKVGNIKEESAKLSQMGIIYAKLSRYEKALSHFQKELAIERKLEDVKGEAGTLTNMGKVFANLGQYEKAVEYYLKASAIFGDIQDKKGGSIVLNAMGQVCDALGHYEKALECYEKVLAYNRKTGDIEGEGMSLTEMGITYDKLGLSEKALSFFQKALVINRKMGDIISQGGNLSNIGVSYAKSGRSDKALQFHEKALEIRKKIGDLMGMGTDHNNIGYLMLSTGKLKQAESHLSSAVQIYESIRARVKSGKERSGFQSRLPSVYENLAVARIALGNKEGAFEAVERGRAKSLLDLLGTHEIGGRMADGKSATLAHMERRLSSLRERRVNLAAAPSGAKARSVRVAVDKEISKIDKQRLKLIDQLRRKDPERGSLVVVDPPSLGEIQTLLTPGTSIVEYFHMGEPTVSGKKRNQLWIFVVRKEGLHFKPIDVTREELKATVNHYARLLVDASSDRGAVNSIQAKLYSWLIEPIEQYASGHTMIIVPWGPMFKIPFASLAQKGGESLGVGRNVVMAPSAGVIRFLVTKRSSGRGKVYAIGNPKTAMVPLQGAEREAKDLAKLFKKSVIKIGAQATESLIKSGYDGLDTPDVVHFACHGIFNEKAPELSYLALTPDQKNDGKLEMHEIFGLDWRSVSLVTMSACSSGKGRLGAGDDLIGLTRGFMFAGASSVLCSLWDVDDEATRALMVGFYKNYISGMSKPESLRHAQIAMMKNPKWSHPYFWSAFVLFGDWM